MAMAGVLMGLAGGILAAALTLTTGGGLGLAFLAYVLGGLLGMAALLLAAAMPRAQVAQQIGARTRA